MKGQVGYDQAKLRHGITGYEHGGMEGGRHEALGLVVDQQCQGESKTEQGREGKGRWGCIICITNNRLSKWEKKVIKTLCNLSFTKAKRHP